MKYNEAKELLKAGKLVTKESWHGFKYLQASGVRIFSYEAETGKCSLSFVPVRSELEATDWVEYTEPVKAPPPPIIEEGKLS